MSDGFAAEWLLLREPFDAEARSVALAERFAALLPARPRILDLGAGTGGLFRWLAPIIGRAQAWTFADPDEALLDEAFLRCAAWGDDEGFAVTWPGRAYDRALLLHTPRGAWRVEGLRADLHNLAALPLARADAVVCSALLDRVSAAWLRALCDALRVPLLACLSIDGRDAFLPRHPGDALVRAGYRRDLARDKGFGPALGPAAPALLRARGAADAPADWRIRHPDAPMLRALVASRALAAARHLPAHAAAITDWRDARLRQIAAGRLAIRVGHRDSLLLPSH